MKYSEKFWLHFKKKDYKESSNFAAENPKVYHPLGFPLHFFILLYNLLAELKNRLKISIFLWRKSCASR